MSASTATTGNTIVQRDSSGNITSVGGSFSGNLSIKSTSLISGVSTTINQGNYSLPITTGTAQIAGLRIQAESGGNVCLDFGTDGSTGSWIQCTNRGDLTAEYTLLLNPNGGNISINKTSNNGNALDVSGSGYFSGNVQANDHFIGNITGNVTGNVSGVLNVYAGNECVIHNGYSGNSSVWINYRGATGTGITEYNMGNGLSAGGCANVRANSFIGSLTGNADSATTATKITATSSTTTQAYLLGVTASGTTPIYDPGIYITSTSGTLHATYMTATTFTGNLTGTASSASLLGG